MKQLTTAVVVVGLGALSAWACGDPFEGCEATKSCPPSDNHGGSGGEPAGEPGSGGTSGAAGAEGEPGGAVSSGGTPSDTEGGSSADGGQITAGAGTAGSTSDGGTSGASGAGGDAGNAGAGGTAGGGDDCDPDLCEHGSCVATNSGESCVCEPGFTGELCTLPRFQPLPFSLGDVLPDRGRPERRWQDRGGIRAELEWREEAVPVD